MSLIKIISQLIIYSFLLLAQSLLLTYHSLFLIHLSSPHPYTHPLLLVYDDPPNTPIINRILSKINELMVSSYSLITHSNSYSLHMSHFLNLEMSLDSSCICRTCLTSPLNFACMFLNHILVS